MREDRERAGVPTPVLREAVRRAAAASSLRQVAREAELAARTLELFLDNPRRRMHGRTLQCLRRWFVRYSSRLDGPAAAAAAAAALEVLLDGIPAERRAIARADVILLLRREHARGGLPQPRWLEASPATPPGPGAPSA